MEGCRRGVGGYGRISHGWFDSPASDSGRNPKVQLLKEDIGMSESKLKDLTLKELRDSAKELGILGRWDMTKPQLIDAIEKVTMEVPAKEINEEELVSNFKETKEVVSIEGTCTPLPVTKTFDNSVRLGYVNGAEVGAMVAFKLPTGKVKSAMIVRKSTKRQILRVETKYGAEFDIPYSDVVWVRSGKRWPRGVYNQLKGQVSDSNVGGKETQFK